MLCQRAAGEMFFRRVAKRDSKFVFSLRSTPPRFRIVCQQSREVLYQRRSSGSAGKALARSLFASKRDDEVHFNKWFRIYTFCDSASFSISLSNPFAKAEHAIIHLSGSGFPFKKLMNFSQAASAGDLTAPRKVVELFE